jgi:hypothetical protein
MESNPQNSVQKSTLDRLIGEFREHQKEKSFSGRHPELGKMVNCPVCSRRHRTAEICIQVFAKNEDEVELIAKGRGHGKGRINRHWNKRSLELVDLTRRLIPFYPVKFDESGVRDIKKPRSRALNLLRAKWHEESSQVQAQQKLSRQINRLDNK